MSTQLKRYRKERAELQQDIIAIGKKMAELTEQSSIKNRRLQAVNAKIASLNPDKDRQKITDHARVRYLERVIGLNIEDLDRDILKQETHLNVRQDGKVVTINRRNDLSR